MPSKHEAITLRTEQNSTQNEETVQICEALSTRFMEEKRDDWMPEKERRWAGDPEKTSGATTLRQSGGERYSEFNTGETGRIETLPISRDLLLRLAGRDSVSNDNRKDRSLPLWSGRGTMDDRKKNGIEWIWEKLLWVVQWQWS